MSQLIQGLVAVMSGIGGFGFGWLIRGIAMDDLGKPMTRPNGRVRRGVWWLIGAALLLVVALVGLVTMVTQVAQQRQRVECVRAEIRSERAANVNLAIGTTVMLDSLLSPEGTVDSRTKAIQDWRAAYAKYLDELRAVDLQHCLDE